MPKPLDEREISDALQNLPGWSLERDRLTRAYTFDGPLPALAMLVHIATVQEELNHHAELSLLYNRLAIAVNTHSEGGRVTALDTELARRIEEIAAGHRAR